MFNVAHGELVSAVNSRSTCGYGKVHPSVMRTASGDLARPWRFPDGPRSPAGPRAFAATGSKRKHLSSNIQAAVGRDAVGSAGTNGAIVPVVEPADVRRHDDRPTGRRHDGAWDRRVFAKRAMCSRAHVEAHNSTPIILSSGTSVTGGIRGSGRTVAVYECSSNVGSP
jgi:hypothetical protein